MRDVFRVAGDDYARIVNWLVLDEDAAWMGEDGVVESETVEIFIIVADASLSRQRLAKVL